MFKLAVESPLNKVDPFPGFDETLKPHLNIEFLKLRNSLPAAISQST